MIVYGSPRDREGLLDALVTSPSCKEEKHLALARGKMVKSGKIVPLIEGVCDGFGAWGSIPSG